MPNDLKRPHLGGLAASIALCVVMLFVTTKVAHAQPVSKKYMEAYNAGLDEFNRAARTGKYDKAKLLFERAIKINSTKPGPYRYLASIAQTKSDWKACITQSLDAAKRNLTSRFIPTLKKMHTNCRKQLGLPDFVGEFGGRGAIHVSSSPTSAKVKLNGLSLGATPLGPRQFSTGKMDVEVSLDGYLATKTSAEVVEGFVTDVQVVLKKDPNAKVGNGKTPPTQADIKTGWVTIKPQPASARITLDGKTPKTDANGRIETTPGMHVAIVEAEGHERWARRVRIAKGQNRILEVTLRTSKARQADRKKGYLLLGGAALFGALSVTFGLLEGKAFEEARDIQDIEASRPSAGNTEALQPIRTRQDLDDAKSRGDKYKLLQVGTFGVAAVALGLSIYYFVKERPRERKDALLPIAITPLMPSSSGIAGVGAQITYSTRLDW